AEIGADTALHILTNGLLQRRPRTAAGGQKAIERSRTRARAGAHAFQVGTKVDILFRGRLLGLRLRARCLRVLRRRILVSRIPLNPKPAGRDGGERELHRLSPGAGSAVGVERAHDPVRHAISFLLVPIAGLADLKARLGSRSAAARNCLLTTTALPLNRN